MVSNTEKEPFDEIYTSTDTEVLLDLDSIKYDDIRLNDPLFCKSVAAALRKYLLDEEPPLEQPLHEYPSNEK